MACYRCGSDGGSDVRLCPNCTAARLDQRKDVEASGLLRHVKNQVDAYPAEMVKNPLLMAGGIALAVGVFAYLLLFSAYGPGWGMSRGDYIYKKCMSKIGDAMSKAKVPPSGDNSGADAFIEAFAKGLPEAMCSSIRDECNKDPNSAACQKVAQAL